jgi:hypothetical protein
MLLCQIRIWFTYRIPCETGKENGIKIWKLFQIQITEHRHIWGKIPSPKQQNTVGVRAIKHKRIRQISHTHKDNKDHQETEGVSKHNQPEMLRCKFPWAPIKKLTIRVGNCTQC